MDIKKSIRVGLAIRNMDQLDLALATGIHRSNISRMINGKMAITHERLESIAVALKMKVSEFVALGED